MGCCCWVLAGQHVLQLPAAAQALQVLLRVLLFW
jgi:hypothetical protein